MKRYSIRTWKDGDGHWHEVRDEQRTLISRAWNHGSKHVAQQDARDAIAAHRRTQTAATHAA